MTAAALIEVVLMGASCGLLGAFVVPRGLTFAGESLSHALLLGAAVVLVAGGPVMAGALAGALVAALAIGALSRRAEVPEDVAVGVVFTGFFGLSVIVLDTQGRSDDLEQLLFGDVLSVGASDLALAAVLTAALLAAFAALARHLVASGFDREFAASIGLRPGLVDSLMLISLAAGLTIALKAVGTLLVLSLLVAPAATARLMARRAWDAIWLAPVLGVSIGLMGLAISEAASLEPGPVIALSGLAAFIVVTLHRARRRAQSGRAATSTP